MYPGLQDIIEWYAKTIRLTDDRAVDRYYGGYFGVNMG